MSKETHNQAHEQALTVLEAAAKEGSLSEAHKARLAELTGQGVRSDVTETLLARSSESAAKAMPAGRQAPAIVIAQPKEVRQLVESLKLEEGYAEVLDTQKVFQLLKAGEKAPDFGQVLRTFTPEMLTAAGDFQNPTLELTTKCRSFNDLITAMDGHKSMDGQRDVYVDDLYKKHASQRPENWGAHIIETPTNVDVQDFDDTELILGERLKRFSKYKKAAKVGGMDRIKYAHVMMQALKEGRPIDDKLWTILDEDPALSDSLVPFALWDPFSDYRRVGFSWLHPGDVHGDFRFRRSVGGDVPNA